MQKNRNIEDRYSLLLPITRRIVVICVNIGFEYRIYLMMRSVPRLVEIISVFPLPIISDKWYHKFSLLPIYIARVNIFSRQAMFRISKHFNAFVRRDIQTSRIEFSRHHNTNNKSLTVTLRPPDL